MEKKTIWQVSSRHALVTCFEENGNVFVEKEISPKNVRKENVEWVNETSIYFRERLKNLGVPLAEPYICTKRNGSAIQTSPYVGADLEKVARAGKPGLLEELVDAIKGVIMQENPLVGIDARLSNFCLGKEGVKYVDTFPALVFYKGEYLVHFPNPTEEKILKQEIHRKFERLGILRRLRFSLLEQVTELGEADLIKSIDSVIGRNFADEVSEFFQKLPDHLPINEALDLINLEEPDAIREIALKRAPTGEKRYKFLSEIFDLSSSYCPYKITDGERIDRIRNLLKMT